MNLISTKGLNMPNKKGSQYVINHSETLLELLDKITSKKRVKESNRDIREENNTIESDGTSSHSTRFRRAEPK